ncbi:E3 ubiquitin-protein ligase TRIM56-like [Littorina saxatilis]|uniref:E3 ubiquitin-protein ligase TRIM56-like n=1 Tax=Littorina saxatilis TaxID=31220 RepID=UPI0038B5EADE
MAEKPEEAPQLTLAELVETDFLRCTQCHKHFTSPTMLPCLHTFCATCVAALSETDVTNGNQVQMVQLQCPLCHSTVTTPRETSPLPFLQSLCQLYAFKHSSSQVCSYCKFDGKSEPAESLCLDCVDDMCEPCAKAHRKTRVTRNHVIAPYEQIQKGLYDHDIRACLLPQCSKHSSQFAHFCCDCTQLACKTCLTDSHKGHKLDSMEAAVGRLRPEASSFVQGLRKRIPALTEYQGFLQSQLNKVEEKQVEVTEKVKEQAQAIHALVDLYFNSLLEDITSTLGKESESIKSRSKDLDIAKQSLKSNAEFLSNLLSVGAPPEVLQLHLAVMARLKQLIHMQTNTMTHRLVPSFQPGPATEQNMRIMFGALDLQRVPVEQEEVEPKARLTMSTLLPPPLDPPQLLSSLLVKQDGDAKDVWPSGLHVRKEKMVVVDRDNKKVKIFDCTSTPPKLKFQFSGKAEHKLLNPFDAVLLENGVVVVTDHGAEKVKVFDVTGRWIGDIAGEFRHPRGIAVTSQGHLVIVDGLLLQLTVHDPDSGKLLQTIAATDNSDNKLLVDPFYVAVTEQDNFVVTDHAAPNIKVFGADGQHLASYGTYGTSASEVLKPYGVCIDRYGQIFVADSDNKRVHLLLPDGTFSCFLLTHQHKVVHPVSVAINSDGHLVVGEAFGKVKIFKYL